jgi:KTSC domain
MSDQQTSNSSEKISFQHVHVQSDTVKSIAYDDESQTLEVRFMNGGLYRYANVPHKKFNLFFTAESKGRYLNEEIKPHYKATRVEDARKIGTGQDEPSQSDPD